MPSAGPRGKKQGPAGYFESDGVPASHALSLHPRPSESAVALSLSNCGLNFSLNSVTSAINESLSCDAIATSESCLMRLRLVFGVPKKKKKTPNFEWAQEREKGCLQGPIKMQGAPALLRALGRAARNVGIALDELGISFSPSAARDTRALRTPAKTRALFFFSRRCTR